MTIRLIILLLFATCMVRTQSGSDSSATARSSVQHDTSQYLITKDGGIHFGSVTFEPASWNAKPKLTFNNAPYDPVDVVSFRSAKGYFMKLGQAGSKRIEFLKRTTEGRIDLYSDHVTGYTQTGIMRFAQTIYVETHFSKDKVTLLPIEHATLSEQLKDNTASMQHLQNYTTLHYAQIGVAGLGLAVVVAGVLQLDKVEGLTPKAQRTILTGAVVMNLAWIPSLMKGGELTKAIREYNK